MTRRLRGQNRTLTIDAYIHRATVGLPRAGRLDAAAELRTHLLERLAEHQAQGFSPEEAEYLAVKGMGEPEVTNRALLGHFFTTPLGWAVLIAIAVGWAAWQMYGEPAHLRLRISSDPDVNDFSNGGALPTYYWGYEFKTPPGTKFVEVAWIGTLGHQRASLAARGGSSGSVFYSNPAWRPWWATRTPLPYADQPWASTCRNQQPVHVQLTVESGSNFISSLNSPNSNLNGVLWCSGLPVPPSHKGASSVSGDGNGYGAYAGHGTVEVQQSDGRTDRGRLRLNHWTLIHLTRQSMKLTYKQGEPRTYGGEAIFVIRPSSSEQSSELPEFSYDEALKRWTVREVAP